MPGSDCTSRPDKRGKVFLRIDFGASAVRFFLSCARGATEQANKDMIAVRSRWRWVAALAVLANAPVASAGSPERSFGVWSNPRGSVHVRAQPCGSRMCGVVVWANDKAQADAARGGTPHLVGSILFRDFVRNDPDVWRGRVFVPDIGKTFSGTIRLIDNTHLEGRGCLVGRVGCRSQIWSRIAD